MGQGVLLYKDLSTCIHACNSQGIPSAGKYSLAPPGAQLPGAAVLFVCVCNCACVYARAHVRGGQVQVHTDGMCSHSAVCTREACSCTWEGAEAWPEPVVSITLNFTQVCSRQMLMTHAWQVQGGLSTSPICSCSRVYHPTTQRLSLRTRHC